VKLCKREGEFRPPSQKKINGGKRSLQVGESSAKKKKRVEKKRREKNFEVNVE